MSLELFDHQKSIIDETRAAMQAGEKSMVIVSPTGSGKTVLTAHMLASSAAKGVPSWFIVHRRELVKQSMRTFDSMALRHGVIASGFIEEPRPLTQIASIGTLANRFQKIRQPKLIVWDECHHVAAGSWAKIFRGIPDAFHVGLTATPERLDGKGLGDYFKRIIKGPGVRWLIDNGFLCEYRLLIPGGVNLSGVHTRMGDYVKSELASVLDKPTITGNAIREYKKQCDGARAVVFSVSIEHSNHIVAQANASGIPAMHVDGETPSHIRDRAIEMFKRGEIKWLSNVDLFGEGFDLPSIECGIDLAPTQSLSKYLQRFGRILRTSPGKQVAIYLDHAGNSFDSFGVAKHGLPDDVREWSLEGREKTKSGAERKQSVRVCPQCFAAQKPGTPICVYCKHEFEIQGREVGEVDGDLVEFDRTQRKEKLQAKKEQGSATSMDALIAIGKKRGYKRPEMWAKYVFNGRQAKKLQGGS